MPKRTAEEKLHRYENKIRKLKQREQRRRIRQPLVSSDDDNDNNAGPVNDESQKATEPVAGPSTLPELILDDAQPIASETVSQETAIPSDSGHTDQQIPPEGSTEINLDPEILLALGDSTSDTPEFGDNIHENLVKLWNPILKKGLPKENKDKLFKECLVPGNCKLLQAPTLNAEISAAVSDIVRGRDKKFVGFQQQLGIGISAINRAMDTLLASDDKIQALKQLSDGCRLLTDLHHCLTKDRVKLITPSLEKSFLHMVQDSERDDTLFGNSLSEKVKASKAIERQGSQIRKTVLPQRTATPQSTVTRPAHQGNWAGPPRYPSNRGGAGGSRTQRSTSAGTASAPTVPPVSCDSGQELHAAQDPCPASAVTQRSSSATPETYPGCREALRAAFQRRGIPPDSLNLMLASLSDSTVKQYNVSLRLWWEFCTKNKTDTFNYTMSSVLSFLTQQFNTGCSYGSLNTHRSALSLFLNNNVGADENVKRLLKGAYKLNPCRPKYSSTWDPQIVLNYVTNWYPNVDLTLERITKKLVILLAICTAHRVQTLSLIKLENIMITPSGIQIAITDIIKTSAPGREQPVLSLPFFRENINICPASILKDYIFVTKDLRTTNAGSLLLTYRKPHKAATAQTISRWIKQMLSESGVNVGMYSAHSTRHAATSAARAAGLSVDAIRKTAGWTSTSTTFARFYNRPIAKPDDFANAVVFPNDK